MNYSMYDAYGPVQYKSQLARMITVYTLADPETGHANVCY